MADPLSVLVTGTGRGLGRELALALARRGARVAGLARTEAEVEATAAACREAGAAGALAVVGDVCQRADAERAVDEAERTHGPLDVLINNAGIAHYGPVDAIDEATLDAMWATNVKGVVWCSRRAFASMRERGRGRILTIASIAGKLGLPGESGYCASKFAAVGFTKALAAEARPHGVAVTAVCPGGIDTPFWLGVPEAIRPDTSTFLRPAEVAAFVVSLLDVPLDCALDEVVFRPVADRH